jgi:urea transport system permease protein
MGRLRILLLAYACAAAPAAAALDAGAVRRLASDASDEKIAAVQELGASAEPAAARVLRALAAGALQVAGDRIGIADGDDVVDAVSGEAVKPPPADADPIVVNNRVRRALTAAIARSRLFDPDRAVRLGAVQELAAGGADPALAPLLARALAKETDQGIRSMLSVLHARATLHGASATERLAAVKALRESGDPAVRSQLAAMLDPGTEPDEAVRGEAKRSLEDIALRIKVGDYLGRVFAGLSLGSILLVAALGLALTFGVMGVINMAHGELLTVGAYAAFAVQAAFHRLAPGAIGWYPIAALPVAFLAAALVGAAMERTVIRFLYGRPLETLLATWGLSLFLIQAMRALFGAQNVDVANPPWLSGGIEVLPSIVLPWNRIAIIGFSLGVLAVMGFVMRRTRLGMFVRAVTQNRAMAGCAGVRTGRIDTLAFAVGSGIAGLGGVALSQIANVGPEMGQGYIVDSFMAVVLGGVGQLAGTVWAAFALGVASKFIEGWTGAVLAKIAVLVLVIAFIQRRPQGLFAPKGRFVEG